MTTFSKLGIDTESTDHWSAHARQWSRIGSPLRPHHDDIETMRDLLQRAALRTDCGLLLGVTPELTQLGDKIIAIDRDRAMVDMLLDRDGSLNKISHAVTKNIFAQTNNTNNVAKPPIALQGNWLALPFAAHSFDFAMGDGSFNLLRYPQNYHTLFEQLRNVLKPAAPLIMRVFTTPARRETCASVIAAAYAQHIESFHAFKWRFAMALVARNRNPNIGVADIHREFEAWIPDRKLFAESTGWPLSAIETIDVYRNSAAVYSFPTAEEWSVIAARHCDEIERTVGSYELAERCPIIAGRLHT